MILHFINSLSDHILLTDRGPVYNAKHFVFVADGFAFSQEEHGAVLQVCIVSALFFKLIMLSLLVTRR